jgi:dTDP-4-amino-4,6-dideoxy-D-galactose acyltransferase
MDAQSVCEYLEWDSEFFVRRIARANVSCLTKELVSEIDDWCYLHKIDCLYFLASSTDRQTFQLARDNQFLFVDDRVTLNLRLDTLRDSGTPPPRIRVASENDIPALRAIARTSHRDSRFYYDGHFSDDLCDKLYETWIEKSCRGSADRVFVVESGNRPAGYLTCSLAGSGSGHIGLLGVAENSRGDGIGKDLMSAAISWFAKQGVQNVTVVTQGRNAGAQRFYQRCGFTTLSVELWFHRWILQTTRNAA